MIDASHISDPYASNSFTYSPIPRILLILVSLISWLILIPPFILQVKATNLPLSILILSTTIRSFILFINAILWPTQNPTIWFSGQGLCDIEVVLINFTSLAILGGPVCLLRQLSILLDPEYSTRNISERQKLYTKIFERTLCIGMPLLRAGLYYIVSPSRYWILGLHGCLPEIHDSWPSILIYLLWPVINVFLFIFFAVVVFYKLFRHHRAMRELVSHSGSGDRLKRLAVFSAFLLFVFLPYEIYGIQKTFPHHHLPFVWNHVHPDDWGERVWAVQVVESVVIDDFLNSIFNLVTFVCFGFGRDAREQYRDIKGKLVLRLRVCWRGVNDQVLRLWRWRK